MSHRGNRSELLRLAARIVVAQVSHNRVPLNDLPRLIKTAHNALSNLVSLEDGRKIIRGYKVMVTYTSFGPEDREARRRQVAQTIARSLRQIG